jgi:hypothetical protein
MLFKIGIYLPHVLSRLAPWPGAGPLSQTLAAPDSSWAAGAKVVLPGQRRYIPDDAKVLRRPARAAIYGRTRPRVA